MKSICYRQLNLAIILLALVAIACNFPFAGVGSDMGDIPISTEAVESLRENLQSALDNGLEIGRIRLVIDEAELTSLFAFELQKSEISVLEEPQVLLRNEHMRITGIVTQGNLRANLDVVLDIYATAEGRPAYDIVSASLSGFPMPDGLVQELSHHIDMIFESTINPRVKNIFIETIEISDGVMIVDGYPR